MRSGSGGASPWRRSDPGGSGELSRVSVATTASSSSERSVSGAGRGVSFLDAFRSCFVPPEARSPETSMSDDFHPSHQRTYADALCLSLPISPLLLYFQVPFPIQDDIFGRKAGPFFHARFREFYHYTAIYCAIILEKWSWATNKFSDIFLQI